MPTITNNVPRPVLDAHELDAHERAGFDYLDWAAIGRGEDSATFFRYHGRVYDLGEFTTTRGTPEFGELARWDGYLSDTFFSATVVRFVPDDHDSIIVGRIYT